MSAFTHPKDIFPWRGLNTTAKVLHFFELRKRIANFCEKLAKTLGGMRRGLSRWNRETNQNFFQIELSG